MPLPLYLGVDVGTGSARAGLFTSSGALLGTASHAIRTRHARDDHYEQSSGDIWRAVCACVRAAHVRARAACEEDVVVVALGIDATCSLVVCRDNDSRTPVSVVDDGGGDGSGDGHDEEDGDVYNVMLWLDRRAMAEAAMINGSEDACVQRVRAHFGGTMSPENEAPKLLWLQRHKKGVIANGAFYDLADYLTFRCTGDAGVRSACTVACKWGWGADADASGAGVWTAGFWRALGLEALAEDGCAKIGSRVVRPGTRVGTVTAGAAEELGLTTRCAVAAGMIDAHCGSLWALGAKCGHLDSVAARAETRVSVVCGTSTCFIQASSSQRFIRGVWGPFRDAMVAGWHVSEGGQSVTGKLVEHVVRGHAAYAGLARRVGEENVYAALAEMAGGGAEVGRDVHVLDHHAGNRSPLADAELTGMVSGVRLGEDEADLAEMFRATVLGVCCGARRVVEALRDGGHEVRAVLATGGLCRNEMFVQELANCLGMAVVVGAAESVLAGGAMLGRCAEQGGADGADGLVMRAREMSKVERVVQPVRDREFYERKYRVYREMYRDWVKYRRMMRGEE